MSNKSEQKFAKDHDAKTVKNSGRGMVKGDMTKDDKYVMDLKEVNKSFTLNGKVWAKACSDAISHGYDKVPMLVIKFENGTELLVMDYWDFDWQGESGS